MKPSDVLPRLASGVGSNDSVGSSAPDISARPTRRLADITPASRLVSEPQSPPTSPKIHELRERYKTHQATGLDLKSSESD